MGTLAAANIPTEFIGAKRGRDSVQTASKNWLAQFSDNPLERPGAADAATEGVQDIPDPDLAGFWSGGEEAGTAGGAAEEEEEVEEETAEVAAGGVE